MVSNNTPQGAADEYQDFMFGTTQQATTRGLVVSNSDPLFSGRVKVWIPSIHGPTPYGPKGDLEGLDPDLDTLIAKLPTVSRSSDYKTKKTIAGLPWASILSHNMGPILDITSNISTAAGSFSIPAVGTEVILIFENNNPLLPVVVGSIIHANEFRYSLARPFEYLPGIALSDVTQIDNPVDPATAPPAPGYSDSYPTLAASVYNVRTASGSTLFMSDNVLSKSIVLEGSVGYKETSTLNAAEAATLSIMYPAFPTTASAAFAKREPLSGHSISPLSVPTGIMETGTGSTTIITVEQAQATASSTTDKTVNQQSSNSTLIKQGLAAAAASGRINKNWPVTGAPRFSSGSGLFLAPRTGGRKHAGIDLGVNKDGSTLLLAPIDCYPLYYGGILWGIGTSGQKVSAGLTLEVLGVDGWGHTFMHMRSIEQNIIDMCTSGKTQLVKAGTTIGRCGVNELSNYNMSSHGTPEHLHWEVFPAPKVETPAALSAARQAAVTNLTVVDPAKTWMTKQGSILTSPATNQTNTVITGTPTQIARQLEYTTTYSDAEAVNFSKPAGLEMSLTPGKETVTLRHPSGSFIGFDPDGNILIYSCGDINFRVNRSITYDVLGAIMESSYARFSRVKTVLKNWSRVFANRGAKDIADSTMPEFYSRVDNSRAVDMSNALASTISNSFIIDSNGNAVSAPTSGTPNAPGKVYASPTQFSFSINYELSIWDKLLSDLYSKYMSSGVANKIFSVSSLKAIMLYSSNGDPSFIGGTSDCYGLFQITNAMVYSVKNYNPTSAQEQQYIGSTSKDAKAAEENADLAVQYLVQLTNSIRDFLTKCVPGFSLENNSIGTVDFRCMVELAYKYGLFATTTAIRKAGALADPKTPLITYLQVESQAAVDHASADILSYVPSIETIKDKISGGSSASSSTSANSGNSSTGGVVVPSSLVKPGDPISAVEGTNHTVIYSYPNGTTKTVSGTIPNRMNNPGNIIKSSFATEQGAIGFAPGLPGNVFAIFPNPQIGYNALLTLLQTPDYQKLTIQGVIEKYCPPNAPGNTPAQTAKYVDQIAKQLNASPNTPISTFGKNVNPFAQAIARIEGFKNPQTLSV